MISLSPEHRSTFSTEPRIITLRPGEQLCRFVTPGENRTHSQFWMQHQTLVRLCNNARNAKIPIHDFAREMLAVKKGWSSNMLGLVFLNITSEIQAFAGPAQYQIEALKNPNVIKVFSGGAEQIVFPFDDIDIEMEFRKFSRLGTYISDIDSLV